MERGERDVNRINAYYVHAPASHNECIHFIPQTGTKKKYSGKRFCKKLVLFTRHSCFLDINSKTSECFSNLLSNFHNSLRI